MKAVVLTEAGAPENLSLQDVDIPQPNQGEVLIRVHSISINPVDSKTRKGGALYAPLKANPPVILGWDVSGVVMETGDGVTAFKKGDEVFGMINFPGHGKAYAEYVAAPEGHLAFKPSNISHEEAAATTLAALTAWQVLVQQANLRKGQTVLVHAAAGGVGHFAVQIARQFGATVIGTASAANRNFLESLGADQVVDYATEDVTELANGIDIVLDPLGGETTLKSLEVLKPGGVLVSIVGGVKEMVQQRAGEKGLTAKNYLVHSSGKDMQQLAEMLHKASLRPTISHRYSLAQIADAHRQIETGKTRGKIVVNLA